MENPAPKAEDSDGSWDPSCSRATRWNTHVSYKLLENIAHFPQHGILFQLDWPKSVRDSDCILFVSI